MDVIISSHACSSFVIAIAFVFEDEESEGTER
jgi:hypothetical protein